MAGSAREEAERLVATVLAMATTGDSSGTAKDVSSGLTALADIDALSQKYEGTDYPKDGIRSERVILFITPERQILH